MSGRTTVSGAYHLPVMLEEALRELALRESGVYVDATLGGGGYSEGILDRAPHAVVFGFDTDPAAQNFAAERLARFGERFILVPENFAELSKSLGERGISFVDGIVFDLGVSSHQLDTDAIGLSYRISAPLDMRLDPRLQHSAADVIGNYDVAQLAQIFRMYGEERFAGRIARNIVTSRALAPIRTTTDLATIVTRGIREDKKNETLSRIFQALRIEVNDELGNLERALEQVPDVLGAGGRIVVVSYHSLEDRIVKEFFRRESAPQFEPGSLGGLKEAIDKSRARLRVLTRRPLAPSPDEIARNLRARSARLRAAERL
ncbi:MAG: 16S rRNA (cytosine(1402)-N(4))-methyltransferase RsmH [Bacteroidota bacterium]|nr:16S rRNA (cytosine(1402)-N(4))-methyltransferase RsmH [Bacteroidota bacterium]MDP4233978.1 16S rRNA (cytosine(1402)-N(4))-methyltransferase RsmH [Bacteroidota bacterium]MDP4242771.1 16S rRNA (cytosine(1402)-N(4))-methyltransferase RsmH [Bacteroidota bacterium]MDP4288485.1 16S rRNA (cytosine(1402)-N(4))-methyltransferase RsmH [Bacteroidota bacterium]